MYTSTTSEKIIIKVTPTNCINLDPLSVQYGFAALDTTRFIENFVV